MRQHEQALLLLRKGAEDATLLAEVLSSKKISNEIFGFHAQQAAEKFLKALLSRFDVSFPRTHNLRLLMDLLGDAGHELPPELADLDTLTPYGTLFRYEDIAPESGLDRNTIYKMILSLHQLAEKQVTVKW